MTKVETLAKAMLYQISSLVRVCCVTCRRPHFKAQVLPLVFGHEPLFHPASQVVFCVSSAFRVVLTRRVLRFDALEVGCHEVLAFGVVIEGKGSSLGR